MVSLFDIHVMVYVLQNEKAYGGLRTWKQTPFENCLYLLRNVFKNTIFIFCVLKQLKELEFHISSDSHNSIFM